MGGPELRTNPDALADAPPPRVGRYAVNGTILYAEVRGTGPSILLIHAGSEDAEEWRPIAERLAGHTVVTYDRRGTLRSGRGDWPGAGSAQHADDAAALLGALRIDRAVVFAGSSAGIVALQLALRHPDRVRRALLFEPGYFRTVPGGEEFQRSANVAVEEHLAAHPGDWQGAYAAFGRAIGIPLLPSGESWHADREMANAEALVLDDIPLLTTERVDESLLRASPVDIRFAHGVAAQPIFVEIATHLAAVRGAVPDRIGGVGHAIYLHPDAAAAYIRRHAG